MSDTPRLSHPWRRIFRVPVYLYRWKCGWLLGHRFLLLVHVGRRTGQRRETVLEVLEYRDNGPEVVVMSGFGPKADWLLNIQAATAPLVIVGRHRFIAEHRFLGPAEAMSVLRRYEQRHRLMAPVVRLVLSRLLGWPYRGTNDERRQVVTQLPFLALRPRPQAARTALTDVAEGS